MTQHLDTTTARFFAHLHRGGNYGYYWQLAGKKSTWWNGTGAPEPPTDTDLYFGVHPSLAIPTNDSKNNPIAPEAARSRILFIAAINCLFADFDAKDFVAGKQGALAHIKQLQSKPSVLIDSGGGYHAYWLLDEPSVITDANRETIRDVQARWVAFVGSDGGAKDLARILRVPGTHNGKYEDRPAVTYVWAEMDTRYTLDTLTSLLPSKVRKEPKAPKEPKVPKAAKPPKAKRGTFEAEIERLRSATSGTRNSTLNSVAFTVGKMIAHGQVDHDAAIDALQDAAREIGLDDKEIDATIASGTAAGEAEGALAPSEIVLRGLRTLGYTFRLNLCDNTIEVNGKPLDDVMEAEIVTRAWDAHIEPKGLIRPAFTTEAAANAYHPIKDYLNGLEWDGGDHIAALAGYITCPDPPIVYDDGRTIALHHLYIKRWLVGAVAKVLEQAQNPMLVTVGSQDIGKSALARWMCSGIPDRFLEDPIRTEDKDSSVRLMSHLVWEVAELDATTRRSDVSALKAFITKGKVTVRKAYGHHDTVKPALASMIGTVNDGVGFLSDETGSRRFLVFRVSAIDWAYSRAVDINQLWAQAVALYRAGEPWRMLPCEATARNKQNEQFAVDDLLDGWLDKYYLFNADITCAVSTADVAQHLTQHDIRLSGNTEAQAQSIGRAMRRRNVPWRHTRRGRRYFGVYPRCCAPPAAHDDDETLHTPFTEPFTPNPAQHNATGEVCEGCEGKNPMEIESTSFDASACAEPSTSTAPALSSQEPFYSSIGENPSHLHTLHTPQQEAVKNGEGLCEGLCEGFPQSKTIELRDGTVAQVMVVTDEWKEIPEGWHLPPGCETSINLTTLRKQARLPAVGIVDRLRAAKVERDGVAYLETGIRADELTTT
jgi:hypothetical protein